MNWKDLKTAPKDGAIIEIKNDFQMPDRQRCNPVLCIVKYTEHGWVHICEPSMYVTELTDGYEDIKWREFSGNPDEYEEQWI